MRGGSSFTQEACHSSLRSSSRGLLSRSVSRVGVPVCFRVPHGTAKRFFQNVQGGILISIQKKSTGRANMGTHAQTLFDARSTRRTILTRIVGSNSNDGNLVNGSIIGEPGREDAPSCILFDFALVSSHDLIAFEHLNIRNM